MSVTTYEQRMLLAARLHGNDLHGKAAKLAAQADADIRQLQDVLARCAPIIRQCEVGLRGHAGFERQAQQMNALLNMILLLTPNGKFSRVNERSE